MVLRLVTPFRGMNRRAHERFPCRRQVVVELGDSGLLDDGICVDVSSTGMALLVTAGLYAVGDDLVVRFPSEETCTSVRVARIDPDDDERTQLLGVVASRGLESDGDGRPRLAASGVRPTSWAAA